jgi:hypothetical protein
MRKLLTSILIASAIAFGGATAYADTETIGGVPLDPNLFVKALDCSPFVWEGVPCWDTDDDILYIGDGTSAVDQTGAAALAAHEADTTAIHGITDTSKLTTSAAALTDNAVCRGDGGAQGMQTSGVTIDDSDNMTIPGWLNVDGGFIEFSADTEGVVHMQHGDASSDKISKTFFESSAAVLGTNDVNCADVGGFLSVDFTSSWALPDGMPIVFQAGTGSLCTGLEAGKVYWTYAIDADSSYVVENIGDSPIVYTDTGSNFTAHLGQTDIYMHNTVLKSELWSSAPFIDVDHNNGTGYAQSIIDLDTGIGTGAFTGYYIEGKDDGSTVFYIDYQGKIYTKFLGTTDDQIYLGSGTRTSGNVFNIQQNISAMTGDLINANLAAGSGTFTGDFLDFNVNSVNMFKVDKDGLMFTEGGIDIGTNGVTLRDDGDGALTMAGNGAGSDEDLVWNFDDVANQAGVSSSTGVDNINFDGISLDAPVAYTETDTDVNVTIGATVNAHTYYNNHASAITYNLPADPEDGSGNGKIFCFRNLVAQAMTINPDDADYIHYDTTGAIAVGEAIVSTGAIGEYVCVQGMDDGSNDYWVTYGINGTWAEETP